MTTASLSANPPQLLVTRTQYVVVTVGCTVIELPVPAGLDVDPGVPMNHWNVKPLPPNASTVSVVLLPWMMRVLSEIELIVTAGQPLTVTVAVLLSTVPHPFVTRTQ